MYYVKPEDYVLQEGSEDTVFAKVIGNLLGKETPASPSSLEVTLLCRLGRG